MAEHASFMQLLGAFFFGAVIGWFTYFTNRYRKEVSLTDVGTLIGALGGSAVLALFEARTDLFGAYGVGLGVGYFGYFVVLLIMVAISEKYTIEYFLEPQVYTDQSGVTHVQHTMGDQGGDVG